jgi:hypothetical protein
MNILIPILLSSILLLCPGPIQADSPTPTTLKPTLDQLSWLAGHWQGGSDGRVTEELWLPPAGGLMLGLNRDIGSSGKAFFEFLRLEQTDQGVSYVASPRGGETTSFNMVECTENKAVFENKAHDFPQRITYGLTGPNSLTVTISGDVDGKNESRSWSWQRLSGVSVATGGSKQ